MLKSRVPGIRVLLPASLLLLPALLDAHPGFCGGRGLLRVQSALVEPQRRLAVSFHGLVRNPKLDSTSRAWVGDLVAPELSYTPLSTRYAGIELFGSSAGTFQNPKDFEKNQGLKAGFHDLRAGAKLSIPIIPVLKLGLSGSYNFTPRSPNRWFDAAALPANDGLVWTGIAAFLLRELSPSLGDLTFNYSVVGAHRVYGASFELEAEGFTFFTEFRSRQPESLKLGQVLNTKNGELRLTPAVAIPLTQAAALKVGYTLSLGENAPNELVFGLTVATAWLKFDPPQVGAVSGRVKDARTGRPVGARISFPENRRLGSRVADPATGTFSVGRAPVGVLIVEVSADGFQRQVVPVSVKRGAVSQYEFALRPLGASGVVAGHVVDVASNRVLGARIEFPGSDITPRNSDPSTGVFRVDDVPVGTYTITAEAAGYRKSTLTVQVEEGRVAAPAFTLKRLQPSSALTGKVYDPGTGSPLAATLSFPGRDIPDTKTDPGTGAYRVELAAGSHAVEVNADGYVTQSAPAVVEANKETVRDFALVKVGTVVVLSGLKFEPGGATVRPESHDALRRASQILIDNPDIRVEIQGHTDAQGSDSYNQSLSEARARGVVSFIVESFGVAADRLTAKGCGESRPLASNDTEAGRTLNRRVELVVTEVRQ